MKRQQVNRFAFALFLCLMTAGFYSQPPAFGRESDQEPTVRREWKPDEPLGDNYEIVQTFPTGAARTVFHYENKTTGQKPQTGDFEVRLKEGRDPNHDKYREQRKDGGEWGEWSDWIRADVGLYYDQEKGEGTHWEISPNRSGEVLPKYSISTTFIPSNIIFDNIQLSCNLVDYDAVEHDDRPEVENMWTGDDEDTEIDFYTTLTTFMVGVTISRGDNIIKRYFEDDTDEKRSDTVEEHTASLLTVDKLDTSDITFSGWNKGKSDNLKNAGLKWAFWAVTQGANPIGVMRGTITADVGLDISGKLKVNYYANCQTSPEEEAALSKFLSIVGELGSALPQTWVAAGVAAKALSESMGTGVTCVSAGLGGCSIIHPCTKKEAGDEHFKSEIQSPYTIEWETGFGGDYRIYHYHTGTFNIDMSDFSLHQTVERNEDDDTNDIGATYDFLSRVVLEDGGLLDGEAWAEIRCEEDGKINMCTSRPVFNAGD